MQVTFFRDQQARSFVSDDLTLEKIRALVLDTQAEHKTKLPWIKLAVFGNKPSESNCLRHDANVIQITGIELDYDDKKIPMAEGIKIAKQANLQCLFYTSPSHTRTAPKWRLLVPTSKPLQPEMRRTLALRINELFGSIFARESFALSQSYYFGYVGSHKKDHRCEIVKGRFIDVVEDQFQAWEHAIRQGAKPRVDVENLLADMQQGNIHNTHLAVAGSLVNAGVPTEQIVERLLQATKRIGKRHWNWAREERNLIRMCETFYAKQAKAAAQAETVIASSAISYADFVAYLPNHNYVFLPTGEIWPAVSVDMQLLPKAKLNGAGKVTGRKLAAHKWLDMNQCVHQMTWAPGLPKVIDDKLVVDGGWIERTGVKCLNLYKPPVIELGNGKLAKRWLELLRILYPDDHGHLIKYFAQRVQQPEIKINHALVLGGAPGIGKDTLLEGLRHAIGPWNFAEISPVNLLGNFNSYIKSVVLRISEARDLGDVNRYSFYEHIKILSAAPPEVLRCNEKFVHEHSVFNVTGIIITTNHKTSSLYLPDNDRRHYIAWSNIKQDDFVDDYWRDFWGWYYEGGFEAVAAYLHAFDLSGFDPKATPLKTRAFWEIVNANRSPEEAEAADAIDKLGNPAAVTIDMLISVADHDFANWLLERKNRRIIPHRFEEVGYEVIANPDNAQRVWNVFDPLTKRVKRQIVYARKELAIVDQIRAARKLCQDS